MIAPVAGLHHRPTTYRGHERHGITEPSSPVRPCRSVSSGSPGPRSLTLRSRDPATIIESQWTDLAIMPTPASLPSGSDPLATTLPVAPITADAADIFSLLTLIYQIYVSGQSVTDHTPVLEQARQKWNRGATGILASTQAMARPEIGARGQAPAACLVACPASLCCGSVPVVTRMPGAGSFHMESLGDYVERESVSPR